MFRVGAVSVKFQKISILSSVEGINIIIMTLHSSGANMDLYWKQQQTTV